MAAALCAVCVFAADRGSSYSSQKYETRPKVLLGIDVLERLGFEPLFGKRIGLLTNPAGVNSMGISTVDVLRRARGVNLVALFGPEHGIYGNEKAEVPVLDKIDARTGLPVYSLYGKYRKPTAQMLSKIDTLVIDLQDVGARSYTYASCMLLSMEACFEAGKEVIVLDRPNPLGGLKVDGPMLDMEFKSYVGMFPAPYVHGLTMGEIASMAKGTQGWLCVSEKIRKRGNLRIIKMSGWRRSMLWADTGLRWVPTSPAIPTSAAAFGYSITGLGAQLGDFRHGYGSNYPFRFLTFKGKSAREVCSRLKAYSIRGLDFKVVKNNLGQEGVYVLITDFNSLRPTELSFYMMKLACELSRGNPFYSAKNSAQLLYNKHVGSKEWWNEIYTKGARANVGRFVEKWAADAKKFQEKSSKFWLYK